MIYAGQEVEIRTMNGGSARGWLTSSWHGAGPVRMVYPSQVHGLMVPMVVEWSRLESLREVDPWAELRDACTLSAVLDVQAVAA